MIRRTVSAAAALLLAGVFLATPAARAATPPAVTDPVAPAVNAACGTSTGLVALAAILAASGTVPLPATFDPNDLLVLTSAIAPACALVPGAPTMKPYAQCEVDAPLANPAVPAPRPGAVLFETAEAGEDAISRLSLVPPLTALSDLLAKAFECTQAAPKPGVSPPGDDPPTDGPVVAGRSPGFPTNSLVPDLAALSPFEPTPLPSDAPESSRREVAVSEVRTWRWGLWLEVVLIAAAAGVLAGSGRFLIVDKFRRGPGSPS